MQVFRAKGQGRVSQMINAVILNGLLTMRDEMPKCEFKLRYVLSGQGNNKNRDEIAKDIIALANTAGRSVDDYAYLILGAGDKLDQSGRRNREDVRQCGYDRAAFLSIVNARCAPRLPDLQYEEVELDGNYYGVITIPPSPHMHELTRDLDTPKGVWRRGSVLIRHGDEVGVASFEEMLLMKREKERLHANAAVSAEASALLSKVQSKTTPLSQCVAEALALARKVQHQTLERFCAKELKGWEMTDANEGSEYRPTYRMIEVYAGSG